MQVHMDITFTLTLTRDELRVVGRALAGLPNKGRDGHLARELNVRIQEQRAQLLEEEAVLTEGALVKAREIQDAASSQDEPPVA